MDVCVWMDVGVGICVVGGRVDGDVCGGICECE